MLDAIIDLSQYSRVSDFGKVRAAGILAIIHKATQGATYVDPTFKSNRKRALKAGLRVGAYHFGTAGDASAQAEHLIAVAGADALLALDFEGNPQGHDMSLLEAEQFVHHVRHVTGRYPGLYSGHTLKEALIAAGITRPEQTELSQCWLWIAQYSVAPLVPKPWETWTIWQFTDGAAGPGPHTVPGVGRCDRIGLMGRRGSSRIFGSAIVLPDHICEVIEVSQENL